MFVCEGSDDARPPVLPQHAYGTSPNPPTDALGVYGKARKSSPPPAQKPLKPIQEQSFVSSLILGPVSSA